MIVADVQPSARVAQEEIFGPVLAVLKAKDLDDALRIANGTAYALTGGLYSRSPANIERVRREFLVGNLYINRGITGRPGRPPAVRRVQTLGHRHQGRRAGLLARVSADAMRHREHDAQGVRAGGCGGRWRMRCGLAAVMTAADRGLATRTACRIQPRHPKDASSKRAARVPRRIATHEFVPGAIRPMSAHSGSSCPRVSGAKIKITNPTKNNPDMATTARRKPRAAPSVPRTIKITAPSTRPRLKQTLEPVARSRVGNSSGNKSRSRRACPARKRPSRARARVAWA